MTTIKIDTGKGRGKNLTKEVYKAWEKEQGVTQNVYEKINELIFDEEIHKYIYCSDPFLRKAFGDFLLSLGFNINETVDAMNECWYFIYVDLEHYVFNYKETNESNSKTSENIQLPYDWNKAKQDVINYLAEHPIPEKEVVEITDEIMNTSNPIGWDDPIDEFSDEFSDTSAVVERTNKIFEFANAKQGYYILCKNKLHGQKIMVAMGFCKNIDKVLGGSNQSAFFFDENRFNIESIELINGDKYGHIGYTIKAMSFADVVADINGETKLQADEKQTILLTECPVVFSDEEIIEEQPIVALPVSGDVNVYLNLPENTNMVKLTDFFANEETHSEDNEFDEDEAEETLDELAQDLGTPITSFIFGLYNLTNIYDPTAPPFGLIINPKEYFDKYGYSYDQHISVITKIPSGFEEMCEADFIYSKGSDIEAIASLIANGFKFNIAFQNFTEKGGDQTPYIINGMPIVDYIKANYPNSIV